MKRQNREPFALTSGHFRSLWIGEDPQLVVVFMPVGHVRSEVTARPASNFLIILILHRNRVQSEVTSIVKSNDWCSARHSGARTWNVLDAIQTVTGREGNPTAPDKLNHNFFVNFTSGKLLETNYLQLGSSKTFELGVSDFRRVYDARRDTSGSTGCQVPQYPTLVGMSLSNSSFL
ncbi:hypothetical protein RRG08_043782 [Elysia crispata]|uniref:Uncharacterized protein n=1 Tax=Elysia crispata TaxID=231223 RepID=A0AAE1D9Q6_9GAST|nr:hypothetical protein RRG08_043782 [Elysia crispata]